MSRGWAAPSDGRAAVVHFLDLVLQYAKHGVRDREMKVFDDLHILGGNHHAHVTEGLHSPALKPRDAGCNCPGLARKTQSSQDVGRVSAGADGARYITGSKQIFELLGENAFVPGIVGPGGD